MPIDAPALLLFVAASLAVLVAPGPAILYVVSESASRGRTAGLVASLGLATGILVHVAATALGLSAVLKASALAFGAVKYAGAAYLVGIGLVQLRAARARRHAAPEEADSAPASPSADSTVDAGRAFRRGFLVNALNPKVAVFFLAFLPQFVPSGGSPGQLIWLGLLFAVLALVVDASYAVGTAVLAGALRKSLSARLRRVRVAAEFLPGLVYIALGVAAAFSPAHPGRTR